MSEDAGPKRDDSKQKAEARNKLRKIMAAGVEALDLFMRHPTIWEDADAKEFREKAFAITGNPIKYPRCKEESTIFNIDRLTKQIGSRLFSKGLPLMSPLVDNILLQVTHAEAAPVQSQQIEGRSLKIRKWKFVAIDGDRNLMILRLDSSLNSAVNLLCPGTVMKISNAIPVYFQYDNDTKKRCAIVVRDFEIVDHHKLAPDLTERPKNCIKPDKKGNLPEKKKQHMTKHPVPFSCNGELYAVHGVAFVCYVTGCVPVDSVSLPMVA